MGDIVDMDCDVGTFNGHYPSVRASITPYEIFACRMDIAFGDNLLGDDLVRCKRFVPVCSHCHFVNPSVCSVGHNARESKSIFDFPMADALYIG